MNNLYIADGPPFPEVIDSSMIAAARSCHQKVYLEFFQHYRFPEPSVHLHAGASYAHGLEIARRAFYEDGKPAADAVALGIQACMTAYGDFQSPEDSAKSLSRTAGAVEFHFDRYPLGSDKSVPLKLKNGKHAIEFSGVEPIDIAHPVTGQPLLYSWRMDMAVSRDDQPMGHDDKTTSQLGASWPKQWDLRSQFTAYCWGAAKTGVPLKGFIIRGVSILKTKYDTLEAITYRQQWQIDRWYKQLLLDVQGLIKAWETGYFSWNLDHSCTEYGGCPYQRVCLSPDPTNILAQMYERRRWDPVTRTETKLIQDYEMPREQDIPL